jgi:hypothetical protein
MLLALLTGADPAVALKRTRNAKREKLQSSQDANRRRSCGGIAGLPCPAGYVCVDDPGDECDPATGGADCPGICIPIGENPCAAILCLEGTTCCPQCGGICIPPDVQCSEDLCVSEPCNQAVCGPGNTAATRAAASAPRSAAAVPINSVNRQIKAFPADRPSVRWATCAATKAAASARRLTACAS